MVLAMDAGPIYALKKLAILPDDNYSSLLQRYSAFTASFALQTIPKLFRGELSPITQDERLVSFAPLIKKEDEHLSLALPLANFIGWVKGLSDEPGGYLMVEDKKLKIYHVSIVSNETLAPVGTLIKVDHQAIHLQVLGGVISLDHLQLEGKPKMLGPIFGNGHRHLLNQVLR
jgi:methionyl-tRNA formyltransferase